MAIQMQKPTSGCDNCGNDNPRMLSRVHDQWLCTACRYSLQTV